MDKQTHDALYNKTIKDVTKSDLKLYEELLSIRYRQTEPFPALGIAAAVFIPAIIILVPFLGLSVSLIPIIIGALSLTMGFMAGSLNLVARSAAQEWLTNLGLTKQEFKDFKKSGGLKRIRNILKEYKKNPYSASQIYQLPNGLTIEDFEKQITSTAQTKPEEKQEDITKQTSFKNADKVLGRNIDEIEK